MIVTLLTPQGTVAAMARGAKRPQSRLAGGVQLCVHGIYTISQGRGMGNLSQLELVDAHRPLRERIDLAAYAAYFCELVAACSEERPGGSRVVFEWFRDALARLSRSSEPPAVVARIWEAKVLRLIGASPDWQHCVQCGARLASRPVYVPRLGGMVCGECAAAAEQSRFGWTDAVRVARAVPSVLYQFAAVPWEKIGAVQLRGETLSQVATVLRIQLRDFGGLSTKSRDFVDRMEALFDIDTDGGS